MQGYPHQKQHKVVSGQVLDRLKNTGCRIDTLLVGHRVRGFDHIDLVGRAGIAVSGHDDAGQRAVPEILEGRRQLGR